MIGDAARARAAVAEHQDAVRASVDAAPPLPAEALAILAATGFPAKVPQPA